MMDVMIMRMLVALLSLAYGLGFGAPVHAESLRVGGTGSAGPAIRLLFEEFRKEAPGASLDLAEPPLGTGGAFRALADGHIDLAFAGRGPKAEELPHVGRHFELAATPFVMASADGQRRDGFSLDELAAVYAGSLMHWDDGAPIRLILRPSFESDTRELKSMAPALAAAVDAAARRPGMVLGRDDLDTLAWLTLTSGSLGPTTLGLLKSTATCLTVFPLNGIKPSVAALKAGTYPWRKILTVILPLRPTPLALRFFDFLHGEKARAILARHDYLPLVP
jgi:phosphate transport system substrate-binding protein